MEGREEGMLEARQEGPSVSSIVVVCCRRRTPMCMQEPFMLWVLIVKVFFVSLKSQDLVAAHVTVVAAVLVCVSAAVSTNSGGDDNLNNGNLVHDTVFGVGRGGHNLVVLQSVGDVGNGGDDRRSVIGHGGGRGGLGNHGSRALDVVDRDTAATEGVGRSVGLSRDRGRGRGGDGLDGLLVVLVASLEGRGVLGSVLNLDVTAEAVGRTSAVVDVENLGHVLDLAHGLLGLGLEASGEDRAVLNATREVGAGIDSLLEGIDVPAVDEISVVSVG